MCRAGRCPCRCWSRCASATSGTSCDPRSCPASARPAGVPPARRPRHRGPSGGSGGSGRAARPGSGRRVRRRRRHRRRRRRRPAGRLARRTWLGGVRCGVMTAIKPRSACADHCPEGRCAQRSGHARRGRPRPRRRHAVRARHPAPHLQLNGRPRRPPALPGRHLLARRRPVRTNADFAIAVDHGPEVVRKADTVVIPPFGSVGDPMPPDLPERVAPLLSGMKRGSRLVSLCGAAYLLAAVGRLDDRPATTHWMLTPTSAADFPRVASTRRPLRRRRRRAHRRRRRRRRRPLPAPRAARPRRRGRQPGRPVLRRPAAPRRRPAAVHRAGGPGHHRGVDRGRPGVGARAPRRAPLPGHPRPPGEHERAHLHPPLPERRA